MALGCTKTHCKYDINCHCVSFNQRLDLPLLSTKSTPVIWEFISGYNHSNFHLNSPKQNLKQVNY